MLEDEKIYTLLVGVDQTCFQLLFFDNTGICIKTSLNKALFDAISGNFRLISEYFFAKRSENFNINIVSAIDLSEMDSYQWAFLSILNQSFHVNINGLAKINFLEAVAFDCKNVMHLDSDQTIWVLICTSTEQIHAQKYCCKNNSLVHQTPINLLSISQLKELIASSDYLCGDALILYPELACLVAQDHACFNIVRPQDETLMALASTAKYSKFTRKSLIKNLDQSSDSMLPGHCNLSVHGEVCLLIDATKDLRVLLFDAENLVWMHGWNIPNQGTEILAPIINLFNDYLPDKMEIIDKIACVVGPGSFTGIRLGLTTVHALTRSLKVKSTGINSLEAIAFEAMARHRLANGSIIWALTAAHRNFVQVQKYESMTDKVLAKTEPALVEVNELASQIKDTDYLSGSALSRYPDLANLVLNKHFLCDITSYSDEVLMTMARSASYSEKDVEPIYVRHADAEDNLERLATRQGLGSKLARDTFEQILHAKPMSSI